MKTINNRTRIYSLLLVIFVFLSLEVAAQPDYVFRNSTLISGTQRQVGAKYRFPRVKTGVDAIVTIVDIKRVELDELDGGDGFDEAFQPAITVPRKTDGYVEFKVDFVNQGGTTPRVMTEVPLTAIDIDGYVHPDDKIYEYDEFKESTTFRIDYDFIGTSLDVKLPGQWVKAINKTAVDYPGVDTVQKDVMFSMIHAGVSSVTFRVGANNKSRNDMQRLRSVYFKKFNYGNTAILAQSYLKAFTGKKEKQAISLNWEFVNTAGISAYILERSVNGKDFTAIHSNTLNENSNNVYSYNDASAGTLTYSYRLKVTSVNGKVSYSQVILFRDNATNTPGKLTVFPTLIQNNTASVQVSSEIATKTMIQVVDYSGRVIYKTPVQLVRGANSFSLDLSGKVASGNYVVVMPVEGKVLSEKVIIR